MRGAGTCSQQPEPGDDRLPGACEQLPPSASHSPHLAQGTGFGECVCSATALLLQVHRGFLQRRVQHSIQLSVCFRQHFCGIFPTFQKVHWCAYKRLFFFWTCHKDLLPAVILLLCSGNDVDKHTEADAHFEHNVSSWFCHIAGHSFVFRTTGNIKYPDIARDWQC